MLFYFVVKRVYVLSQYTWKFCFDNLSHLNQKTQKYNSSVYFDHLPCWIHFAVLDKFIKSVIVIQSAVVLFQNHLFQNHLPWKTRCSCQHATCIFIYFYYYSFWSIYKYQLKNFRSRDNKGLIKPCYTRPVANFGVKL